MSTPVLPTRVCIAAVLLAPTIAHAQGMQIPKPSPGLSAGDVAHVTAYVRAEQHRVEIR